MIYEKLAHYRIINRLGEGGMGEVYVAEDTKLGRRVAIKVLTDESATDEDAQKRLIREARAAANLDHPNICAIHEVGTQDSLSFIVMQYVEGETLADLINRKALAVTESLDIACQIADALGAAHALGIIHRDIKPQNVMITAAGQVKVLDFGLAKIVRDASHLENFAQTESLFTRPGTVMGTVPYMSPEQVRGESVDTRSDLFSLGALLYEMVTGHQPFAAESAAATFSAILTREPSLLARYSADAPAELQRIVSKALAKSREERYQTSKDLLIDLKQLKQRIEFETELARPGRLDKQSQTTVIQGKPTENKTIAASPVSTDEASEVHATGDAEFVNDRLKRSWRGLVLALALVFIAAAGIIYFALSGKFAGGDRQVIDSIAVLPFVNNSSDSENEYLSDGITESLINSLSQIPHLRVMSRNSVFRFKGPETDAKAAGSALGVSAVLTGRITQHGQDLIISSELIDVRNNSNLWGKQYSRRFSDIFTIQAEIAKEISDNLRLKLSGIDQSRVNKRYTDNPEAYELYLKGRYFWNKFTPADHQRATDYFNQAIAKDPKYALAYTGLADTYTASAVNSWIAPAEGYLKAKIATKTALDLDDTLAEAHASMGAVTMFYDFDWAAAELENKRALELNPKYTPTYEVYAYLLTANGRLDEGIEMARRGLETDPLSVLVSNDLSQAFYFARKYDEGIRHYQKSLELEPADPTAYSGLGAIYDQKGMHDDAIGNLQRAINLSERTSQLLGWLGHAYAASGKRVEALKILDELQQMSKQKYVSPFDMAVVYTGLGDKEKAIEQLQKAYQERSGWLIYLKVEPVFDPLRSDKRFQDLLGRIGL